MYRAWLDAPRDPAMTRVHDHMTDFLYLLSLPLLDLDGQSGHEKTPHRSHEGKRGDGCKEDQHEKNVEVCVLGGTVVAVGTCVVIIANADSIHYISIHRHDLPSSHAPFPTTQRGLHRSFASEVSHTTRHADSQE